MAIFYIFVRNFKHEVFDAPGPMKKTKPMKKIQTILTCLLIAVCLNAKDYNDQGQNNTEGSTLARVGNADLTVKTPDFIFENTHSNIEIRFKDPANPKLVENNYVLTVNLNGQDIPVQFDKTGLGTVDYTFKNGESIQLLFEDFSYRKEVNVIALWMVLVPVGLVMLLITLRFMSQRAKKKTAARNLEAIESTKLNTNKEKPQVAAPQEEEITA